MRMRSRWLVCLALSLAVLGGAAEASAQGFKWWQDERFKEELALTGEQIARLEEIFRALQPTLKTQKETLDKVEARLSKVINDPRTDEATVLQVIDKVEAARGDLSRSRTLMGFRMRRILTSDQNVKMTALHDQWVRERRNRSNPPRQQRQ